MSFQVVADELRSAADELETEVEPLDSFPVLDACYADTAVGHVELNSWLTTVDRMIADTAKALGVTMDDIGAALDYVAMHYESTDGTIAMCFAEDPITALGLPEGFDPGPPRIGPAQPTVGSGG